MQFRGDTVVRAVTVAVEDNADDNIFFVESFDSYMLCYAMLCSLHSVIALSFNFDFETKQFIDYFDSTSKTRGPTLQDSKK
jgi:hypothetical protein